MPAGATCTADRRQSLQEVVGNEEIAAIIGPKKAETVGRVTRLTALRLSGYGILVKQFTINELRAPASVMEVINQMNVMQQQALTASAMPMIQLPPQAK